MQYIDVSIPSDDDGSVSKEKLLRHIRPTWNEGQVVIKVMPGGYVNLTIHAHHDAEAGDEDDVIIRCYKENYICAGWLSHDRELSVMQLAHHAGCFGRILATFKNGVVYQYKPGRSLKADEILDATIARLIARNLAQFHATDINTLPIVDKYGKPTPFPAVTLLDQLCVQLDHFVNHDGNSTMRDRIETIRPDIEDWKREMTAIVSEFNAIPLTRAFCHNDIHARNVLYDENSGSVTFVDYEAGKFGFAALDFSYMFNFYLHHTELGVGPVPRETRLIYARSYLERKYELQGRDAGCLKQEEIEAWLIEIQLADILVPFVLLVLTTNLLGSEDIFQHYERYTGLYHERKVHLAHLRSELERLRRADQDIQ